MKKVLRIGVAVIVMVALVLGYYYYLSNRNASVRAEENVQLSEVEAVIAKDFQTDYPASPRAAVKWYNRIITTLYAEEYDNDEFAAMADQMRCLLDDELLEYNPRDSYLVSLTADVNDFKNRSCTIVNSEVCDTHEVRYDTVKGDEVAYVSSYYFIREGSSYTRTYQDFCLRKDSRGQWKILTIQLSKKDDTNEF